MSLLCVVGETERWCGGKVRVKRREVGSVEWEVDSKGRSCNRDVKGHSSLSQ